MNKPNTIVFGVLSLIILLIIYLRERSWSSALLKSKEELQEKSIQLENAFQLLGIERESNQYSTFVTFQFAEKCLGSSLVDTGVIEALSKVEILALYRLRLQECHEQLIRETSLLPNQFSSNSSSLQQSEADSSAKLSLLSPSRLFDRFGVSCFIVVLCLILSETFFLYNLSSPQPFQINGKTYERSDFLEKPLSHALEIFLVKEHPFTSFLLSLALYAATTLLYLLSFLLSWSNAYYYQLFHRLIQFVVVYFLSNISAFLIFNSVTIFHFLKKMYSPKSLFQIIAEQYRKRDFWWLVAMKLFRVYDLYDFLLVVLWFAAQLLFLLPLLFSFYYYDAIYLHTDISATQSLNSLNHFMLITWPHLFLPFVCCYYLIITTIILPFLPPQQQTNTTSTPFIYENLMFNSSNKKSLLRWLFDYLMRKRVFYFDRGDNSSSADSKTLKSQDMRIGLIFFINVGNSGLYLLRFLYIVLFKRLTVTWLGYLNNWFFLAFHVFILLYTLPVVNLLLYKYEVMKKFRSVFHDQIIQKFEEALNGANNEKNEKKEDIRTNPAVQEEIEIGMNLFDFALHKSVLYCLFIQRDDNQDDNKAASASDGEGENGKGSKNDVAAKLERVFTSFLQSDAFAFGVKFANQATEEQEEGKSGQNGSDYNSDAEEEEENEERKAGKLKPTAKKEENECID